MHNSDLVELVTSLVDNEIDDEEEVLKINLILQKDENLAIEYNVQKLVKNSLTKRFSHTEAPYYLEDRIHKNIKGEIKKSIKQNTFYKSLFSTYLKPQFILSAIGLILIVLYFSIQHKSLGNYREIIKSQIGNSNMFVQAMQNFNYLVNGELKVQIASNDSKVIKDYFAYQGVNYQTYIPVFNDLELLGGVVTERNGEKFAHHIYKCKSGKFVYIYQVDENCIKIEKVLHLSNDLINLIDEGKNCAVTLDNNAVIIWKCKQNINILVSNENLNDMKERFLASR